MLTLRRAERRDGARLAELIHFASEGLAMVHWRNLAGSDGDPWEVGRNRQSERAGAGIDEIWVLDDGAGAVAGLTGYPIGPEPEQPDAEAPPLFRPLIELEALAPESWYVNVLATVPTHRGKGLGTRLLRVAEERAAAAGMRRLSLIVSDANIAARRLYERLGFREEARRPMVKDGWHGPGLDWVLMIHDL